MKYSRIFGTGSYLPPKTTTNADLEKLVDTSDQWIMERTGIRSRHISEGLLATTDMAIIAAERALTDAAIDKNAIGLIVVATTTPDVIFPSTATRVQHALGLDTTECPAFDVAAACAGFIYALDIADQYIRNGSVKYALVVSSESVTRVVDWQDRATCILFGDGAGAVVLGADEKAGICANHLHANGAYADMLGVTGNMYGSKQEPIRIKMRGNEVFKIAVNKLGAIVEEVLLKNNLDKSAIDWLVPHQANLRIISATARKLNMSMDKVILTIEDQGNTSAASVPLALDIGIRDGRIKRGDLLLLEAFGAGMAWGASLIRY
jgi:3-oxoacyl-[acyl-carrier-protein] synthase III